MTISIIIPTYNESALIEKLVTYLISHGGRSLLEVIISDGGSTDDTMRIAEMAGATAILSPDKGRASQMNYGAGIAKGDVFYFIHADCYPPTTFVKDIMLAINNNNDLGRYRTRFDSDKWILKFNAWLTRFDLFVCMGGDQTLFIKKYLFEKCKGFKSEMKIMEEYEFCKRARQHGRYTILKGMALISARKYNRNGWLSVQFANAKIISMYHKGATQIEMVNTYNRMLK